MANLHVDLYNGDDANDGSTWALAKKTVTSIKKAMLSVGDTVKVTKTNNPEYLCDASWEYLSPYIITKTPQTKSIETAVGNTWTAVAPVTLGTFVNRKYGDSAQNIIIPKAVVGKLAFKTRPETLDLSTFTTVSFYSALTSGTLDNFNLAGLYIALCSDTDGNTIVNTIPLEQIIALNSIQPNAVNTGGALGSNINSIALYKTTSISADIRAALNNIFATNELTLFSIIGRSVSRFTRRYAIKSIIDDTITLDNGLVNYWIALGHCESTETDIPLYIFEGIKLIDLIAPAANTYLISTVQDDITYSGGWDKAIDMQTGETWFDGVILFGYCIVNGHKGNIFDRFCGLRYNEFCSSNNSFASKAILNTIATCCNRAYNLGVTNLINALIPLVNRTPINIYSDKVYCKNITIENYGGHSNTTDISVGIIDNANFSGRAIFEDVTVNRPVSAGFGGTIARLVGAGYTFIRFKIISSNSFYLSAGLHTFIDSEFPESINSDLGYRSVLRNVKSNNDFGPNLTYYNFNQIPERHVVTKAGYTSMHYCKDAIFGDITGIWEIVMGRSAFDNPSTGSLLDYTEASKQENNFYEIAEIAVEKDIQTSISLWIKRTDESEYPPTGSFTAAGTKGGALVVRPLNSPAIDAEVIHEFEDGLFDWKKYNVIVTPTRTGIVTLEIQAYWDFPNFLKFSKLEVFT